MMHVFIQSVRHLNNKANKLIASNFQQMAYNVAGFNKYGLYIDDILDESPVVIEALRRLPEEILDERKFRIIRAGYLSLKNDILPKEQWIKFNEDVRYLQPIIKQVEAEFAEMLAWENE